MISKFQHRVYGWVDACFGKSIAQDKNERNYRFLEESLELVQSLDCTKEQALSLVEYVYGRDAGEPRQEVGGVMITLAALCAANEIDMEESAETELARVWTKVEKIREKQRSKPHLGAG